MARFQAVTLDWPTQSLPNDLLPGSAPETVKLCFGVVGTGIGINPEPGDGLWEGIALTPTIFLKA
ncbi:hypothetical protein [Pseudomonas alvandae]|uniref:hypothetical protein n=1 Tax=Pseudomonas canavaninivorans TaxID=2842348 RepID=UPI00215E4E3D|nr:hypothetical protein [Pseudomonas canavaninivorans]UVM71658.1 hypothetical protein LOY40_24260 [Pseudomonas canavaninivorans]